MKISNPAKKWSRFPLQGSDSIRMGNHDGSVPVPPNRVPALLHRDWVCDPMDSEFEVQARREHVHVLVSLGDWKMNRFVLVMISCLDP
jgi:hypothetical protein